MAAHQDSATQTAPARRPIRPLPTMVANQIAAGEVVERPASVVKELVENAIDAGATRIRVELEAGGIELVRITDDGCGIPPDELPLAIAPHATSKLDDAEQLERIATLGFRGEALASVSSVARVSIRSRTADSASAHEIDAAGAEVSAVRPASGPPGTTISVRTLFFNTPARRKFLRTPTTEQSRCADVVRDIALAHPAIGFDLVTNSTRTLLSAPAGQSPRARALSILGQELEPELLEVSVDGGDDERGVSLWGLIGRPAIARGNARGQHLFINGRAVRDKTIQHAMREAYRGLIDPTRTPTAVLMLEVPPIAVDVNVHPAKSEVRFRDQSMVHSLVHRTVRDALRAADLVPAAALPTQAPTRETPAFGARDGVTSAPSAGDAQAFVDFLKHDAPQQASARFDYDAVRTSLEAGDTPPEHSAPAPPPAPSPLPPMRSARLLQVHNSYVIAEEDDGVVIVDQHALHERVMFEELMGRVEAGPLESQRLLSPGVVPTTPERIDRLGELGPLLRRIGIEAEPMGPRTIGVHAFPTLLFERGVEAEAFVSDLLDRAETDDFVPDSEAALHEVLDMMACKAAVKAGDKLSEGELGELLAMRDRVERSTSCPHGRPTTV
ncbi:MAG: DNA mismatch repair endonuclease MutL [Planctomycetota bacterium]